VKTVFRFLVTATGLVLILMALGIILFSTQAGSAADLAIERGLGYVYQSKVTVDRVTFLPRESSIAVHGLAVFNPAPFKEGAAIEIEEIFIRVDAATLLSEMPVVNEIVLRGAEFNVRYEAGRGTNLGKLDENASRLQSTGNSTGYSALLSRNYSITEFRSETSQLNVSAGFIPGAGLNLTLAPFDVQGLGGSGPVSTARICTLLIRNVFREALSMRGLIQPVADRFNDELQRLREHEAAN